MTVKCYKNKKPSKMQNISDGLNGGDEGSRTPVRKHFLKDFSGRSHLIQIPSAARQMTGLRGR